MTDPQYKYWLVERTDGIIRVIINRPAKMNAFTIPLMEELFTILEMIRHDNSIRVMILAANSDKYFCAGADMQWFAALEGDDAFFTSQKSHRIFGMLEKLPIPVISVIKGTCFTAGLELAMCSDMIYAAENAQFGQLETRYGITPGGGGTQRLTRLVGPLKAKEIIFSSMPIDAREAHRIGLVNNVFSLEEIDAKVEKIARGLCKNSQRAIKEAKFLIHQAIFTNPNGFHQEEIIFQEDFASGEPRERLTATLKKMQERAAKK